MRRLSFSDGKLRGIGRRLRSLERWTESFKGQAFPGLKAEEKYYNWKIPVHELLVIGRRARPDVVRKCAQLLIDACGYLMAARQPGGVPRWNTASICVTDMFSSEVTIYTDEEYFQGHTSPFGQGYSSPYAGDEVIVTVVTGRSLAREWGLALPEGMGERGIMVAFRSEDPDDCYFREYWYYGDVK
jgi:hypothetical protein